MIRHERNEHGNLRLRIGLAVTAGLLLVAGTAYAGAGRLDRDAATPRDGATPETSATSPTSRSEAPTATASTARDIAALEDRVRRLSRGWAALDAYYRAEVAPIEQVLLRYRDDDRPEVGRIAAAVVREAKAAELEPRLLLGVLLVENPWLDPTARSSVGAVGLMQVMPVHTGGWSCGYDLERIDTNVCLGARVFAHYLDRTGGDVERALLRYNGCVNGTNTPNCHLYPSRVLARAGGAALAWAGQGSSAASP